MKKTCLLQARFTILRTASLMLLPIPNWIYMREREREREREQSSWKVTINYKNQSTDVLKAGL